MTLIRALLTFTLSLHASLSSAEFDAELKKRLTEELHSGTRGTRLSQIYQEALLEKFAHLPSTSETLKGHSCIIFAVGSVGRHEAVYGSDLEAGIFCERKLEESTVNALQKSLEADVPYIIWDSEFTLFDHQFFEANLEDDLSRAPNQTLLKLLDASPIAYIHCSPETFSFSTFRSFVLQRVFTESTFTALDRTHQLLLRGDLLALKAEIEEGAQPHEPAQPIILSELIEFDDTPFIQTFFYNPFHHSEKIKRLIQCIDLKQTFYRIITHAATIRYLDLCKLNLLKCTADSWKTRTDDRLQEILSVARDSVFSEALAETMDTFLALRMGTMLSSNHNFIENSDIQATETEGLLFFKSIPQRQVLHLIRQVLSISKDRSQMNKNPASRAL